VYLESDDASPYHLIMGSNRDEFFDRPTLRAHFWEDMPNVLAGRDLSGNGTWLGVHACDNATDFRVGLLTNHRELDPPEGICLPSRGCLVTDFLAGDEDPRAYSESLDVDKFSGFNLIVGDIDELYYVSNRADSVKQLKQGVVHGVSNGSLDDNWFKVEKGKLLFEKAIKEGISSIVKNEKIEPEKDMIDSLFRVMQDDEKLELASNDDSITGVFDRESEYNLSSIFVNRFELSNGKQ